MNKLKVIGKVLRHNMVEGNIVFPTGYKAEIELPFGEDEIRKAIEEAIGIENCFTDLALEKVLKLFEGDSANNEQTTGSEEEKECPKMSECEDKIDWGDMLCVYWSSNKCVFSGDWKPKEVKKKEIDWKTMLEDLNEIKITQDSGDARRGMAFNVLVEVVKDIVKSMKEKKLTGDFL